ncbi:MAG TPA: hypothetical protein VFB72_04700 [Verrucomicrobiae bacterium]|nr:hypothetical protein [Verrucomicrobiae bacterium]
MNPLLTRLMANKHTTGAGVVFIACEALSKIGAIWFPAHSAQFAETLSEVQKLAVTYGLVMGADAGRKPDDSIPPAPPAPPTGSNLKTAALIIGFFVLALELHRLFLI